MIGLGIALGLGGRDYVAENIDELLAVREQRRQEPVTEDDLPEDAHLLENRSSSAVYLEYRTCGDESCSCMRDGEKHGPYKYRAYRDGDTVRRGYLGKATDTDTDTNAE
ncbi:DUF6788 family protein [Halalkalicoccus salilacus]|uniref:DUF6788 family protein n=1 Tax=Halalkalicoccus salilacus TaxID=3117459 RepID=UPI00300F1799